MRQGRIREGCGDKTMETNNEEQERCNYKLFRHEEGFSLKTVLLVGNGAIKDGDIPLKTVVYAQ